jgi:hypothetical protein
MQLFRLLLEDAACGSSVLAPALDAVEDSVDPRDIVRFGALDLRDETGVTYLPFSS